MRRSRAILAGAAGLVLALGGYATLDVYDEVPGILTLESAKPAPVPEPGQSTPPAKTVDPPRVAAVPAIALGTKAPTVSTSGVTAALKAALVDKRLPSKVGITVRDAETGAEVFDKGAATAMTPASVTKLLTAWVVSHTLDLEATLPTSVVSGRNGHVVLVAGGDMMLGSGAGNPNAVVGRAGLGDLAAQVASALKAQGQNSVTLDVDLTHAPGELKLPTWDSGLLDLGYTTRVSMLGLASERSDPGTAAALDPVHDVMAQLAKNLRAKGVAVTIGTQATAASGATQLGKVESATIGQVLGQALLDSDNALTENLARQAAYSQHIPGDEKSVAAWVMSKLKATGVDTTGLHLVDVCGLSDGTTFAPDLLGDLLTRATTGKDPHFSDVLAGLAIGGYNGTVHDRFLTGTGRSAAGYVRAKTGSLPQVSSLAGTVVDKDGRTLVFAIITNGSFPAGVVAARAAIDDVVAALQGCGCR